MDQKPKNTVEEEPLYQKAPKNEPKSATGAGKAVGVRRSAVRAPRMTPKTDAPKAATTTNKPAAAAPKAAPTTNKPAADAPKAAPTTATKPADAPKKVKTPTVLLKEDRKPDPIDEKKMTFRAVYLCVVACLVVILAVGLLFLGRVLAAYEETRPVHVAEKVFEAYFAKDDFTGALEEAGFVPTPFETAKAVSDRIAQMKEGKTATFYAAAASENEARYNVVFIDPIKESAQEISDGEIALQVSVPSYKIATIVLTKNESASRFGFSPYEFTALEIAPMATTQVTVTAPADAHLFLNDVKVTSDHLLSQSEHPYNALLPTGVPGITLNTYRIAGLFAEPTVTCKDNAGRDMEILKNEDGTLEAQLNSDETLAEKWSETAVKGVEAYAAYIQADGGISAVSKYFDTTSLFYKNTARNPGGFVWDHDGFRFEDEQVGEFISYDENTFSCHVSMIQVLVKRGSEDYRDKIDMIVFFRKVGNTFKIYDRMTVE